MNAILVRLNMSQEQYDGLKMTIYLRWCMDFCTNYENELQKVMSNPPINRYFLTEFSKCENEFIDLMQTYDGVTQIKPSDALATFKRCSVSIYNRFPKVLIINAKKPTIISYDATAN